MLKIPDVTNIESSEYTTIYKNKIEDNQGNQGVGLLVPMHSEIWILNSVCRILQEKTWVHETLHGICNEMNYEIEHDDLDTMANLIYDTFTRNKVDFRNYTGVQMFLNNICEYLAKVIDFILKIYRQITK